MYRRTNCLYSTKFDDTVQDLNLDRRTSEICKQAMRPWLTLVSEMIVIPSMALGAKSALKVELLPYLSAMLFDPGLLWISLYMRMLLKSQSLRAQSTPRSCRRLCNHAMWSGGMTMTHSALVKKTLWPNNGCILLDYAMMMDHALQPNFALPMNCKKQLIWGVQVEMRKPMCPTQQVHR